MMLALPLSFFDWIDYADDTKQITIDPSSLRMLVFFAATVLIAMLFLLIFNGD